MWVNEKRRVKELSSSSRSSCSSSSSSCSFLFSSSTSLFSILPLCFFLYSFLLLPPSLDPRSSSSFSFTSFSSFFPTSVLFYSTPVLHYSFTSTHTHARDILRPCIVFQGPVLTPWSSPGAAVLQGRGRGTFRMDDSMPPLSLNLPRICPFEIFFFFCLSSSKCHV
ncbi:hypothetical protein E2C01_068446 [Portunus trituberculatus]|uniref:Transmembrane protein n=1 Tax=Portunus trituberculatus TaxID=210409 RepID=A0A5B7HNV3_PORTR|nr:hypothetical protein [Portunus trituberculatus]